VSEPTGTQRHAHHIMCGMDRICPACGKTWFAALAPEETPICKIEDWQPGVNWYPAGRARHSPALVCFAGEQCEMCKLLVPDPPKRSRPLSEYLEDSEYE
jgi:hypothetical protein